MAENIKHYFIEDDTLSPQIETFSYYFGAEKFTFTSNSGMFSPGHVDGASDLFLHTLPRLSGSFLDLGCGYGVIGIVVGRLYPVQVTLADINGRALDCARINCASNHIQAEIVKSDCFDAISRQFDVIALNPPIHAGKAVVYRMYQQAKEHLNPGGKFFVVIQKKHGAESTIERLTEIFGGCQALYRKKGYYVLEATKRSNEFDCPKVKRCKCR